MKIRAVFYSQLISKYSILLVIVLLLATKGHAQDCEYEAYYPLVKLASKNYTDKDYKAAASNLKKAFTKTDYPLGADLHLALKTAQKLNDGAWLEQISICLAKGGVPLMYFRYLKNQVWYEKFNADFLSY